MNSVTASTAKGSPVGTAKGIVHLFDWTYADRLTPTANVVLVKVIAMCGKVLRGNPVERPDDEPTCQRCIDESDSREARSAGFEHRVSVSRRPLGHSPIAGNNAMQYGSEVNCYACPVESLHERTIWSTNLSGQKAKAEEIARQHFLEKWREYKAAQGRKNGADVVDAATAALLCICNPTAARVLGHLEACPQAPWTGRAGVLPGTRVYKHPAYPGWLVASLGRGFPHAVHLHGDRRGEFATLDEAFRAVATQAAEKPPVKPDSGPRRRQYIVEAETYYADTRRKDPEVLAELRCGIDAFTEDGYGNGCAGEWFIEWIDLGGWIIARVKVASDSWKTFVESGFPEVMDELGTTKYREPAAALAVMVEALRSRGWVDATQRVDPDRS